MTQGESIYVFTDLDDSLFQTRGKCPDQQLHLSEAALDRGGQALSYFTAEQRTLVAFLEHATLIPVTGRNTEALARVFLRFTSYRITSHGALILTPQGNPEPAWFETLLAAIQPTWTNHLQEAIQWLKDAIFRHRLDLRARIIEDQGLPVYLSVKGEQGALDHLEPALRSWWRAAGGRVHRNGHNMALLPDFVSKERAVAFLIERFRAQADSSPLFLGIGDSLTDLPYLKLCHYALVPRHSQIQKETWP